MFMKRATRIKTCVILAVLILVLNVGSAISPLLIKAQTLTSGYKLKVDYHEGYATISADTTNLTSGYQLVSLTKEDGTEVSDNPATFTKKITQDGTYTYKLNYTLAGIDENQTQSEDITVEVKGIDQDDDTPKESKYQITNNFNTNNDYESVTINPQKDVTQGTKVTVSFVWPQSVQSITSPKITGADGKDLTDKVELQTVTNDQESRKYEFTFEMPAQDVTIGLDTVQATVKTELEETKYEPIYTEQKDEISRVDAGITWMNYGVTDPGETSGDGAKKLWVNFNYGPKSSTSTGTTYANAVNAGKIYFAIYTQTKDDSGYTLAYDTVSGKIHDNASGLFRVDKLISSRVSNRNFWTGISPESTLTMKSHGIKYLFVCFTNGNEYDENLGLGYDNTSQEAKFPETLSTDVQSAKIPMVEKKLCVLDGFEMVNGNEGINNNGISEKRLVNESTMFNISFTIKTKNNVEYTQEELDYMVSSKTALFWVAPDYGFWPGEQLIWYWTNNPWDWWPANGPYSFSGLLRTGGTRCGRPSIKSLGDGKYQVVVKNLRDEANGVNLRLSDQADYYVYVWNKANTEQVPKDKMLQYRGSNLSLYGVSNFDSIGIPWCRTTTYIVTNPNSVGTGRAYGSTITYPSSINLERVQDEEKGTDEVTSGDMTIALHAAYTDKSGITHIDEGDVTPDNPNLDYPYKFTVSFGGGNVTTGENGTTLKLTQNIKSEPATMNVGILDGSGNQLSNGFLGTLQFATTTSEAQKTLTFQIKGKYDESIFASSRASVNGKIGYIFDRQTISTE